MAQQMVNGSHYDGSVTITNRMSRDYAVVSEPFAGKHKKPQDRQSLAKRHMRWLMRRDGLDVETINRMLDRRQ